DGARKSNGHRNSKIAEVAGHSSGLPWCAASVAGGLHFGFEAVRTKAVSQSAEDVAASVAANVQPPGCVLRVNLYFGDVSLCIQPTQAQLCNGVLRHALVNGHRERGFPVSDLNEVMPGAGLKNFCLETPQVWRAVTRLPAMNHQLTDYHRTFPGEHD